MNDTKPSNRNWEFATYEGAEEYQKRVWRKLSCEEKFRWLEEARQFVLKLRFSKPRHGSIQMIGRAD